MDATDGTGAVETEEEIMRKAFNVLQRLEELAQNPRATLEALDPFSRLHGTRHLMAYCLQELAALSGLLRGDLEQQRQSFARSLVRIGKSISDGVTRSAGGIGKRHLGQLIALGAEIGKPPPESWSLPRIERMAKLRELVKIQQVALGKASLLMKELSSMAGGQEDRWRHGGSSLRSRFRHIGLARAVQIIKDPCVGSWLLQRRRREGHEALVSMRLLEQILDSAPSPPFFPRLVEELETAVSPVEQHGTGLDKSRPEP